MSSETILTGSCMCGNVTYKSTSLPTHLTNCYCKTCRRLSGAPFLTFGDFPTSAISFTSPPPSSNNSPPNSTSSHRTTSYTPIATRTHCSLCGSHLSMQYRCEPETIAITIGTIDEESVKGNLPKVKSHIFVEGEKVGAYVLPDDGVTRYKRFPGGFEKRIEGWKKAFGGPGLG